MESNSILQSKRKFPLLILIVTAALSAFVFLFGFILWGALYAAAEGGVPPVLELAYVVLMYVLTIVGVILFYRAKPAPLNSFSVPIGFACSPFVVVFLFRVFGFLGIFADVDTIRNMVQPLILIALGLIYFAPFLLVTLIISIVRAAKGRGSK